MKSTYVLRAIFVLISLVLASCGLLGNPTPPSVTAITTSPPVNTSTPVTASPSATNQPMQTSTLTPISTLSEEDALETFTSLIESDNGCNFPCWLGVIPGQTNFDDVNNEFSQYSAIAFTKFSSEWASIKIFFPNFETAIHATTTDLYPASDGKVSRIWVYAGVNPKGINGNITYSNPAFQKMWQQYFVAGIFTKYGPPEKILLDTTLMAADPATSYPFALWIIYPQQGFLIRYDGLNIKIGENIRVCPMQSNIQMEIWDVETSSYEELIKNEGVGGISHGPKTIESVTDFDIQSFYEQFKKGNFDTCFETPASIWPPN